MKEEEREARAVVLMEEIKGGSHSAFSELYLQWYADVYRFSLRLLKDPHRAEEACQETFLDLYRSAKSYREEGSFRSFLFTLAVNRCRKELNRRTLFSLDGMEDPPTLQGGEDPEENLIGKELADLLWERFQSLPEHQRFALTLVLEEGLSYEETARALKVTLAQVKSWVFRGRNALRRVLESYEGEGRKEPRKEEEG